MRVIPILMVSSTEYLSYLAVMMWSVLKTGSAENEYRFCICHCGIPEDRQLWLQQLFRSWKNCRITFKSVRLLEDLYGTGTVDWNGRIPCFSVFAGDLFPEYSKMLALDLDLIVLRDVAELFDIDVENSVLAATYDLDFIGQWRMKNRKYRQYYTKMLKLKKPMEYIQSGVMVLNLHRLREKFPNGKLFHLAANTKFRYDDQDIWNLYCAGEIQPLDLRWNVMHDNDRYRLKYVISLAPPTIFQQYLSARQDPWVIHYAGNEKPWNVPTCDFGTEYWAVADQMPIAAELRVRQRTYVPPVRPFPLLRALYYKGRYQLRKLRSRRQWLDPAVGPRRSASSEEESDEKV